jgi:hypothetical protein
MGLVSSSRYNSVATNGAYFLRAAVEIRAIPEQVSSFDAAQKDGRYAPPPNWEVIGECGHRLEVVRADRVASWRERIEAKRRHRRRCEGCPRG